MTNLKKNLYCEKHYGFVEHLIKCLAVFQFLETGLYRDFSSVPIDCSHLLKPTKPYCSGKLGLKKKTLDTIR